MKHPYLHIVLIIIISIVLLQTGCDSINRDLNDKLSQSILEGKMFLAMFTLAFNLITAIILWAIVFQKKEKSKAPLGCFSILVLVGLILTLNTAKIWFNGLDCKFDMCYPTEIISLVATIFNGLALLAFILTIGKLYAAKNRS